MTCSPFKNSFLNLRKIRQKKIYDGSNGGEPSYSGKRKTHKDKLFCPGCDE
jgi:hypothetical protein